MFSGVFFAFLEGGYVLLEPTTGVHPGDYPEGECVLDRVEFALPDGAAFDPAALSEVLHSSRPTPRSSSRDCSRPSAATRP
jgi:hypothetical protein